MSQDNASFTFLHRIEEVELNIEDGRWQSALALALTLPDICGGIAFPEIVKRYRDGRAVLDRNRRPTRDVGNQYIRWFDTYAAPFFKVSAQDISPYICGERCWQLRCEYLHQNKGFANTEDNTSIRFHLGVNCGTSVCQLDRISSANSLTDIRIDIEQFCRRMCRAARAYYEAVHTEKDFNLYGVMRIRNTCSGRNARLRFTVKAVWPCFRWRIVKLQFWMISCGVTFLRKCKNSCDISKG